MGGEKFQSSPPAFTGEERTPSAAMAEKIPRRAPHRTLKTTCFAASTWRDVCLQMIEVNK
jgi:hypothetical protein